MEPEPREPAPPRRALAPREVPVGRRWVPRAAITPSRALPDDAPADVRSDVIVWSHARDAVGLVALFLASFTVTRVAAGRAADLALWLATLAAVALALGLFFARRHRVEADADGIRRLGVRGWRLSWDEIAEVRLDATHDAAGSPGWFRLGARASSVDLTVVPGPKASRRAEAHAAVRSGQARPLGELARHQGVPTREATPARRAAS